MRSFILSSTLDPVPSSVVEWLRIVDQGQGREQFYRRESGAVLDSLTTRSRVESVIASNEIEGIRASRRRAEDVIESRSEPRDRSEYELAGYRSALDDIYSNPHGAITLPRLLGWHRELLRNTRPDIAGKLKVNQNVVEDRVGNLRRKRFDPVSPAETEHQLRELLIRSESALTSGSHPVIVTAAFVLDLLVIHPFEDGNGRTARVATNAALTRDGYTVGRYISLERIIERHRDRYYNSLEASTTGWHDSQHSIWPWAEFFAEIVAMAYADLDQRATATDAASSRAIVFQWLAGIAPSSFSFSEARSALAGIPSGTIRSVLNDGRAIGALTTEGAGRGSRWRIVDRSQLKTQV